MLVLSRKCDQSIMIGSNINVRVLAIEGNRVRLGIEAPKEIGIRRAELSDASHPSVVGDQPRWQIHLSQDSEAPSVQHSATDDPSIEMLIA